MLVKAMQGLIWRYVRHQCPLATRVLPDHMHHNKFHSSSIHAGSVHVQAIYLCMHHPWLLLQLYTYVYFFRTGLSIVTVHPSGLEKPSSQCKLTLIYSSEKHLKYTGNRVKTDHEKYFIHEATVIFIKEQWRRNPL